MYKTLLTFIAAATLAIGCNIEENNHCSNGVQDFEAGETEIDCGGENCEPCPPDATMSATLPTSVWYATSFYGYTQHGNTYDVGAQGTAGAEVTFQFVGVTLNANLPITDATIRLGGWPYYEFELADTGSVRLTNHDEVRRIISGTFSFSVRDNNDVIAIGDGEFENVRY